MSDLQLRRHGGWLHPVNQVFLAAIVCVGVPFCVLAWTRPAGISDLQAQNSALAGFAAIVAGFWLHRSLGKIPGTQESSGILAGYLLSFGGVLAAILLFRISYSRAMLLSTFVLTLVWFFLVYAATQRRALRLGVVGGGSAERFRAMPGVRAFPLRLDTWPERVDAVAADFREDHDSLWQSRLADYVLAGIPVYHAKDLCESLTGRADLEHLSENNLGALNPHSSLLFGKAWLDRLCALPALVILAPVMLVAAIAIRIDSPGPAFFCQRRTGYRGKPFTVFKFRTMVHRPFPLGEGGGEADAFITRPNDERITRVGAVLRHCRIDELPQILNILRGEMSWIGPRPEACALSSWYEREIPFYRYRYVVRPGITGWAQVNQGHVAEVHEVRTKLQYDFYYIRNFSAWLDFLIVAKTVKTMLTGFGHR